jgi:membrane peptidoglycan carboxypeptidase
MTIARLGSYREVSFLEYVEDVEGKSIWDSTQNEDEPGRVSSVSTQVLVGMLKQTALTGTAQKVSQSGFRQTVAGKTGTTNDNRDTWFVGFTPDLLTVVWTGYDNNTSSGLTGASGSLPAWLAYMVEATRYDQVRDFPWTDEVELRKVPLDDLLDQGFWDGQEISEPQEVELIFKKRED